MKNNISHTTVLMNEAVIGLNIKSDGVYIDGTFGRGGHSRLILSKLGKNGRLFAFDCDPAAIEAAKNLKDKRFTIIHSQFSLIEENMMQRKLLNKINGVLLDLGVSSPQLDDSERGFSFMRDGPLDMRMDNTKGKSAAQWLAHASINDITKVLKTFGEEKFAKRIAQSIVDYSKLKPITRTHELASLISEIVPIYNKYKHPATRSFQAIRIYINNELEEIKKALAGILKILALNGRLSVISFHSLEHRLIKQFIRQHSCYRLNIPTGIALTETQINSRYYNINQLKIIDKVLPSTQEINYNPRARSAILRIAEKIIL